MRKNGITRKEGENYIEIKLQTEQMKYINISEKKSFEFYGLSSFFTSKVRRLFTNFHHGSTNKFMNLWYVYKKIIYEHMTVSIVFAIPNFLNLFDNAWG